MERIAEKVIKKHPLPWRILDMVYLDWPCIRDDNDTLVLVADWNDLDLLNFIAYLANN